MPLRAIASIVQVHFVAIFGSICMGLFSGLCYIVGTAAPDTAAATLNASTKIEGSPYALGSIIAAVAVTTWYVASLVTKILDGQKVIMDRLEALEEHADHCPGKGRRR